MKLPIQQLTAHLQNTTAPIYFISGDEPLLEEETCNSIRHTAEKKGYTDRQVFYVETGFSWPHFFSELRNLSLFSTHTIMDLRLGNNKITDAGRKTLQAYAENPIREKVLIIRSPKLDANAYKTKWLQAIDQVGVIIQLWPIDIKSLPAWTNQRLQAAGLNVDAYGLKILVEHGEGNLLALQQNIEKLKLLYPQETHLNPKQIIDVIFDGAHYTLFDLADAMLLGDSKRSLRILKNLQNEGTEAILILWAFTREIRLLVNLAKAIKQGKSLAQAFQQAGIWEKRKFLYTQALQKYNLNHCINLLMQANKIDRIIKGADSGNVWNELQSLSVGWISS